MMYPAKSMLKCLTRLANFRFKAVLRWQETMQHSPMII